MEDVYQQLRSEVIDNGGFKSIPIEHIRDMSGYERLGSQVRKEISNKLHSVGLEHQGEIPSNQGTWIRIYVQGGRFAELLHAVSAAGVGEDDHIARVLEDNENAEEVLNRIRLIICE